MSVQRILPQNWPKRVVFFFVQTAACQLTAQFKFRIVRSSTFQPDTESVNRPLKSPEKQY